MELRVCHLAEELDVPQPLVSHHQKVWRDVGLESEKYRYRTYDRPRPGAIVSCCPTPGDRRRPCE